IAATAPTWETSYNSGDVFNNRLYVKNVRGGLIYVINIDKLSPGYLTLERTLTLSNTNFSTSDFVIDPKSGEMYTVSNENELIHVDLETGKTDSYGQVQSEGGDLGVFGAQFIDTNGFLYGI